MTPNEELYCDIIGTGHESDDLFLDWQRRAGLDDAWLLPPYDDPFWAAWRREGQLEEKAWLRDANPRS